MVKFGSGQISEDSSIDKCEKKIIFNSNALEFIICVSNAKKKREEKKLSPLCRPARKNKQLFTVFIQINCSLRSLAHSNSNEMIEKQNSLHVTQTRSLANSMN